MSNIETSCGSGATVRTLCLSVIGLFCEEAGLEDLQLCRKEEHEIYLRSPDSARECRSLTREDNCKDKESGDNLEPNFKERIRPISDIFLCIMQIKALLLCRASI
jgi:hypothetical protein